MAHVPAISLLQNARNTPDIFSHEYIIAFCKLITASVASASIGNWEPVRITGLERLIS